MYSKAPICEKCGGAITKRMLRRIGQLHCPIWLCHRASCRGTEYEIQYLKEEIADKEQSLIDW